MPSSSSPSPGSGRAGRFHPRRLHRRPLANTVTCPAGHSVTITQLAGQCSIGAVVLVRCASAAPGPRTARPSPWVPTTANLWPLAAKPPTPPSRPATGAGGPCGTLDRLAGRQRPPPGPLPRSGPQPARSVSPGGRDQSTPAGHHGTGPPPWRVGPGLNQALSGPGVSMRDDSTARASSVAGLDPQAPALRIGQLPGPPSSLRHQSPAPKAGYSAAS
jgi:hypothetical protein